MSVGAVGVKALLCGFRGVALCKVSCGSGSDYLDGVGQSRSANRRWMGIGGRYGKRTCVECHCLHYSSYRYSSAFGGRYLPAAASFPRRGP